MAKLALESGDEVLVNQQTPSIQSHPGVATLDNGNFVSAWSTLDSAADGSGSAIRARIFNAGDTLAAIEIPVNVPAAGAQVDPVIAALPGSRFVIVWHDSQVNELKAQLFDATGGKVGPERTIVPTEGSIVGEPSIAALDGDRFVVAWKETSNRESSTGQPLSGDIYAQAFNSEQGQAGPRLLINEQVAFDQGNPAVAGLGGGNFVVVWESAGSITGGTEIRGREFSALGASNAEFQVNVLTAGDQLRPTVATMAGGQFVVAWQTNDTSQDGSGAAIKARLFTPDPIEPLPGFSGNDAPPAAGVAAAAPVGGEFLVNVTRPSDQTYPVVAALAGGGFVAAWETLPSGEIRARFFDASGIESGPEFAVNPDSPATGVPIAMGTSGDALIVAWPGTGADANDVKAQAFTITDLIELPPIALALDDQNLANGSTPQNPDFVERTLEFDFAASSVAFDTDLTGLLGGLTWQRVNAALIEGRDGPSGTGNLIVSLTLATEPGEPVLANSGLVLTLDDPERDDLRDLPVSGLRFSLDGTAYQVTLTSGIQSTYAAFVAGLNQALDANPALASLDAVLQPDTTIRINDPQGRTFVAGGYDFVGGTPPANSSYTLLQQVESPTLTDPGLSAVVRATLHDNYDSHPNINLDDLVALGAVDVAIVGAGHSAVQSVALTVSDDVPRSLTIVGPEDVPADFDLVSGTWTQVIGADQPGAVNDVVINGAIDEAGEPFALNAPITVRSDGITIGTLIVRSNGTWELTPDPAATAAQLSGNSFDFTIRVRDADGDRIAGSHTIAIGDLIELPPITLALDDQNLADGSTPQNPDFVERALDFDFAASSIAFGTDLTGLAGGLTWQRVNAGLIEGRDGPAGSGNLIVSLTLETEPGEPVLANSGLVLTLDDVERDDLRDLPVNAVNFILDGTTYQVTLTSGIQSTYAAFVAGLNQSLDANPALASLDAVLQPDDIILITDPEGRTFATGGYGFVGGTAPANGSYVFLQEAVPPELTDPGLSAVIRATLHDNYDSHPNINLDDLVSLGAVDVAIGGANQSAVQSVALTLSDDVPRSLTIVGPQDVPADFDGVSGTWTQVIGADQPGAVNDVVINGAIDEAGEPFALNAPITVRSGGLTIGTLIVRSNGTWELTPDPAATAAQLSGSSFDFTIRVRDADGDRIAGSHTIAIGRVVTNPENGVAALDDQDLVIAGGTTVQTDVAVTNLTLGTAQDAESITFDDDLSSLAGGLVWTRTGDTIEGRDGSDLIVSIAIVARTANVTQNTATVSVRTTLHDNYARHLPGGDDTAQLGLVGLLARSGNDIVRGGITITVSDDIPRPQPAAVSITADSSTVTFDLAANTGPNGIYGADGPGRIVAPTDAGLYGTITLDGQTGALTYTLSDEGARTLRSLGQGQTLVDSFSYAVVDGDGDSVIAPISVTLIGEAPIFTVRDDSNWIQAGEAATAVTGNVLANIAHGGAPDGLLRADVADSGVSAVAPPPAPIEGRFGRLTLGADGSYIYRLYGPSDDPARYAAVLALRSGDPAQDDVFTYALADVAGAAGRLAIAVFGGDEPATLNDDSNFILDGQASAAGNVLANTPHGSPPGIATTYADVGDDPGGSGPLSVNAPGSRTGQFGTLTLAANGSYTYRLYTAAENAAARAQVLALGDESAPLTDTFTYTVAGSTDAGQLRIDVYGIDDPAVVNDDTNFIVDRQAATTGNVLLGAQHGSPPGVAITYADVADSDVDTGDNPLTVVPLADFAGDFGRLTLGADGSYTYRLYTSAENPAAYAQVLALSSRSAPLQDIFAYTVNGAADAGQLTIDVYGVDDPTLVNDDTNFIRDGQAATTGNVLLGAQHGSPPGVATNYADVADVKVDADGAPLTVGPPFTFNGEFGTLTLAADGSYSYRLYTSAENPAAFARVLALGESSAPLSDSFDYAVTGVADSGRLTIDIYGVNDAPVARGDTNWVQEDGASASGNVLRDLAHPGAPDGLGFQDVSDSDPDGAALTVQAGTLSGAYGRLVLQQDGSYSYSLYTEAENAAGFRAVQALGTTGNQTFDKLVDTFSYTVSDGSLSTTSTLGITVYGRNDAPTAQLKDEAEAVILVSGASRTFTVAAGDIDDDPATLIFSSGDARVESLGGGDFRFTPAAGSPGVTEFAIDVRDDSITTTLRVTALVLTPPEQVLPVSFPLG